MLVEPKLAVALTVALTPVESLIWLIAKGDGAVVRRWRRR